MRTRDYPIYSDEELLDCLRQNDHLAFAELYNRYHKQVYRYLISLVKVPEITEDLLHEVFLKLWEIREKLQVKENFKGYLFRICHNKSADMMRKIAGERSFRDQLLHHYQDLSASEHHTLEELLRYDHLIEDALNTLSPQRRKVYELCRIEGKTYKEAAEALKISPHTVKEHMSGALDALRNFLKQRGELALVAVLIEATL